MGRSTWTGEIIIIAIEDDSLVHFKTLQQETLRTVNRLEAENVASFQCRAKGRQMRCKHEESVSDGPSCNCELNPAKDKTCTRNYISTRRC